MSTFSLCIKRGKVNAFTKPPTSFCYVQCDYLTMSKNTLGTVWKRPGLINILTVEIPSEWFHSLLSIAQPCYRLMRASEAERGSCYCGAGLNYVTFGTPSCTRQICVWVEPRMPLLAPPTHFCHPQMANSSCDDCLRASHGTVQSFDTHSLTLQDTTRHPLLFYTITDLFPLNRFQK